MSDEISKDDIETTMRVLETLRDDVFNEPGHPTLNASHALVDEFGQMLAGEPAPMSPVSVSISFRDLMKSTKGEVFFRNGYDVVDFEWMEGGLRVEFEYTYS